ncbi:MAG: peptidylprolyl isomerase [Comamonas sp.]|jgi:peptidylprolyl isomerase|nr:peptidylprolyl isomerase [Comamonas sp.]
MKRQPHTLMARSLCGAGIWLALQAPQAWSQQGNVPVISSGQVSVSSQELQTHLASLSPGQREQLAKQPAALEQWARAQLSEKLLLQEASAQRWEQQPEVARQLEKRRQEWVARSYLASVSKVPDDYPAASEVAAAYERLKSSLLKPAGYRVSQVFLAASTTDVGAQKKAQQSAGEVVKKARQPQTDFAKLAQEYGSSSGQLPADTGWVTLEQLLPEARSVVVRLKPGEVSEPVASAAGLHVLKLLDMRPAQTATLEEVAPLLKTRLRQEKQSQLARAYMDKLGNGAAVKVDLQAVKTAQENAGPAGSP